MQKPLTSRPDNTSITVTEHRSMLLRQLALALGAVLAFPGLIALIVTRQSVFLAILGLIGAGIVLVGSLWLAVAGKDRGVHPAGRSPSFVSGTASSAAGAASDTLPRDIDFNEKDPMLAITRSIAMSTTPDELLLIFRRLLPEIDRISLLAVTPGPANVYPKLKSISVWDRDNIALNAQYPSDTIRWLGEQPVIISNIFELDSQAESLKAFLHSTLQAASLLSIPLPGSDDITGYLLFSNREPYTYEGPVVQSLLAIAHHIAAPLNWFMEQSQLQHELNLNRANNQAIQSMIAAQNVEEIYNAALSSLAQSLQANRGSLYIAGPDPAETAEYVDTIAIWEDGILLTNIKRTRYDMSAAPVLSQFPHATGTIVINEAAEDSQLSPEQKEELARRNVNSLMIVPLSTGSAWFGVIVLELNHSSFDDSQAEACHDFAKEVAHLIENQLMVSQVRLAVSRERKLREVIGLINAAQTIDTIVHLADTELADMLNRPIELIQRARLGERGLLNPAEWQLVLDVDRQAQLAISNLHLAERTRRSVAQERLVSRITTELQRAAEVDDVLETTVSALRSVLSDYDITLHLEPDEEDQTAD
ncbi:MAG: GAF domain-containing protein [Anaerolineae bacterium]|nr:GAF domain-containing protein [Anaerolineae bacterium]